MEDLDYSPTILIYLKVGEQTIRLSDVLYDTATIYEPAEVPPGSEASLVFSINGIEQQEDVILPNGISKESEIIQLQYPNN